MHGPRRFSLVRSRSAGYEFSSTAWRVQARPTASRCGAAHRALDAKRWKQRSAIWRRGTSALRTDLSRRDGVPSVEPGGEHGADRC